MLCQDTAATPAPPRALAMAAAARREHLRWGSPTLDAHGRLTRSGQVEAEDTRGTLGVDPPWQRVLDYWDAVPADSPRAAPPAQVRFGAWRPANRHLLSQALAQASQARLAGLGVGPDEGLATHEIRALEVALARVAVIDTPWSAAFVSWLAREAGLSAEEFVFSEAHADYAARAWAATQAEAAGQATASALRACELPRTPPRVGDLICAARGATDALHSFPAIGEALQERLRTHRPLPMHCDVVSAVDAKGFDVVGGNVLDAVTARRLDFAPGTRLLDPSYLLSGACEGPAPGTPACADRHMSRQPWTVLLQWR